MVLPPQFFDEKTPAALAARVRYISLITESHSTTQKSLTRKRKAKVVKEEGRTRGVLSAHVNPTSFLCLLEA